MYRCMTLVASSGRIKTDSGANSYLVIDLLCLSCQFDLKLYHHHVHVKISSSYSYALNSTSRGNKCQNHQLTSTFIECLKRTKSVLKIQYINTFYMSRRLSISRLTQFFKLNCSQIILKNLKESFQNNVSYSSETNTEPPDKSEQTDFHL